MSNEVIFGLVKETKRASQSQQIVAQKKIKCNSFYKNRMSRRKYDFLPLKGVENSL